MKQTGNTMQQFRRFVPQTAPAVFNTMPEADAYQRRTVLPEGTHHHGRPPLPAAVRRSDLVDILRKILPELLPGPFVLHEIKRTLLSALVIMPKNVLAGKAIFL